MSTYNSKGGILLPESYQPDSSNFNKGTSVTELLQLFVMKSEHQLHKDEIGRRFQGIENTITSALLMKSEHQLNKDEIGRRFQGIEATITSDLLMKSEHQLHKNEISRRFQGIETTITSDLRTTKQWAIGTFLATLAASIAVVAILWADNTQWKTKTLDLTKELASKSTLSVEQAALPKTEALQAAKNLTLRSRGTPAGKPAGAP